MLAGCSPMVKLSWVFRSSSSAAILRRETLVSRSNDSRSTASAATSDVPSIECDRLDRGVVILGFHDDIEQLVSPFERADQSVGDLPACHSAVVVGHG